MSPLRYLVVTYGVIRLGYEEHITVKTYRLILLVKVVYVAVQNLNEKFDGYRGVHAGVCYTQSTLQTFEHTFTIAIKLLYISNKTRSSQR